MFKTALAGELVLSKDKGATHEIDYSVVTYER